MTRRLGTGHSTTTNSASASPMRAILRSVLWRRTNGSTKALAIPKRLQQQVNYVFRVQSGLLVTSGCVRNHRQTTAANERLSESYMDVSHAVAANPQCSARTRSRRQYEIGRASCRE